jgi:hypothetical protein
MERRMETKQDRTGRGDLHYRSGRGLASMALIGIRALRDEGRQGFTHGEIETEHKRESTLEQSKPRLIYMQSRLYSKVAV